MWIKSTFGLFNTDHIGRFEQVSQTTFAHMSNSASPKIICHSPVLDKIEDALKNGVQFLEVE